MTRVSVVVPSYRRPDFLERCLLALESQERLPDEVVVVLRPDDDESARVVERNAGKIPEGMVVTVAPVHKSGHEPALNAGLAQATGVVVCFTDDDAEPFPDWVRRIEEHLGGGRWAGVGGRVFNYVHGVLAEGTCREVGRIRWYGKTVGNFHFEMEDPRPVEVNLLRGVNMAFRRDALDGILFDERLDRRGSYGNEIDLCFQVRRRGGRILYDPLVRVDHHWAPREWWASREDRAANIFNYSHNHTYVMMKHLGWRGWLGFLPYFVVVGQRTSPGFVTTIINAATTRRVPRWRGELAPALRGKAAGVRSYLRARRDAGRSPDEMVQAWR